MADDPRDSKPPGAIPSARARPDLGPVGTRPSVAPSGLSLPSLPRDDASTMDLAQLTSRSSTALSPELEELLLLARDRIGGDEEADGDEVREEIEDVLPSEILASLDEPEPVAVDDEGSFFPSAPPNTGSGTHSGSGSGSTGTSGGVTTGTGRAGTGSREQTNVGRPRSDGPRDVASGSPTSFAGLSASPRAPSDAPRLVPSPGDLAAPRAPAISVAPAAPSLPPGPTSMTDKPPTVRGATPELAFERRFSQLAPPMAANDRANERDRAAAGPPTLSAVGVGATKAPLGRDPERVPRPFAPHLDEAKPAPNEVNSRELVMARVAAPRATLALAVAEGATMQLTVVASGASRFVFLDAGDVVTAASDAPGEDLVGFLATTGVMPKASEERLRGRVPPHGKRAGAALVAHGELSQDELWSVLRGYAEWVLAAIIRHDSAEIRIAETRDSRFAGEPSVFGGATGSHIFVDVVRRTLGAARAISGLGTPASRLVAGDRYKLLRECGLSDDDEALVREGEGRTVGDILARRDFEFASVLLALCDLRVSHVEANVVDAAPAVVRNSVADVSARERLAHEESLVRARVAARLALVDEGDYFAILGVKTDATGYEIRRAFLELRRAFDPHRLLTPASYDLAADVRTIVLVLEEAYEILRDAERREKYRVALFARGPG